MKRLEALTGLRAHEMFDYCIGKTTTNKGWTSVEKVSKSLLKMGAIGIPIIISK